MQSYQALVEEHGSKAAAARALGIPVTTFKSRLYAQGRKSPAKKAKTATVSFPEFPDSELPTEKLIEARDEHYRRVHARAEAQDWFEIGVRDDEPIGVVWATDPHLDDDGCAWAELREDVRLMARTPAVYAISGGDLSNNWIGRLARLWGEQSTTHASARRLIEWYLLGSGIRWLALAHGNHDCLTPDHEVMTRRGWVKFPDDRRHVARQSRAHHSASQAARGEGLRSSRAAVPSMTHLICLAGAGGTGKSSICAQIMDSPGPLGSAEIHGSVTRRFYAANGVDSEAAFLSMSDDDRRDFQLAIYRFYLTELESALVRCEADVMICDRSIFDHYAYTLAGSRGLGEADIRVLEDGIVAFKRLRPRVFYCPYPTPWEAEDGFRAREPAKDAIVDALIYRQLNRHLDVFAGTIRIGDVASRAKAVIASEMAYVGFAEALRA